MIQQSLYSLHGFNIYVLPDNDKRFDDIPRNSVAMQGNKMLVRESEWTDLRKALREATEYKPDPNCTCDPYGACAYCWNGKKHDTAPKPGEMK